MNIPKLLVEIILDKNADWADRHDALIDLGHYNEPFIEDALMQLILDPDEDGDLRSEACVTLACFWENTDHYNLDNYLKIHPGYRRYQVI